MRSRSISASNWRLRAAAASSLYVVAPPRQVKAGGANKAAANFDRRTVCKPAPAVFLSIVNRRILRTLEIILRNGHYATCRARACRARALRINDARSDPKLRKTPLREKRRPAQSQTNACSARLPECTGQFLSPRRRLPECTGQFLSPRRRLAVAPQRQLPESVWPLLDTRFGGAPIRQRPTGQEAIQTR
jgi:hypothetical protein